MNLLVTSVAEGSIGGLIIFSIVSILNFLNDPFASRLLPLLPMTLLICGVIIAHILAPASVYLRAHKKEPYALLSISLGVMIGLSSFILGKQFSAIGVAVAYLGSNLILFPWGLAIFYRSRRKWHYNPRP